ncbi:MAG: cytochrome c [Methylococcales bacterium]
MLNNKSGYSLFLLKTSVLFYLLCSVSVASDCDGSVVTVGCGKRLYHNLCVLCHGGTGDGQGKMAKYIKNPPPTNLILSRVTDEYMREIIIKGGEAMVRSSHMPPGVMS